MFNKIKNYLFIAVTLNFSLFQNCFAQKVEASVFSGGAVFMQNDLIIMKGTIGNNFALQYSKNDEIAIHSSFWAQISNLDGIVKTEDEMLKPNQFKLYQNYPNPFNPSTTIEYSIPSGKSTPVTIIIFDILGNKVGTIINKTQNGGEYKLNFDTTKFNLASGIYFYQLRFGNSIATKKMILLK